MKNKVSDQSQEKYKGQTKRIWYQKGFTEGRIERTREIKEIIEGMGKEETFEIGLWDTYDSALHRVHMNRFRNAILSDVLKKIK